MKSAYELLLEAPDGTAGFIKMAHAAIACGQWDDAYAYLDCAAKESTGQWSADCIELANFCAIQQSRA